MRTCERESPASSYLLGGAVSISFLPPGEDAQREQARRLLYVAVAITSGFMPKNGQFSIPAAIGLPSM